MEKTTIFKSTQEQRAEIERRAASNKMSLSEFIRERALNDAMNLDPVLRGFVESLSVEIGLTEAEIIEGALIAYFGRMLGLVEALGNHSVEPPEFAGTETQRLLPVRQRIQMVANEVREDIRQKQPKKSAAKRK